MKQLTFEQLKETLYHEKLENGLDVYILPKEGFNKTFATFTTKYGSIDNKFTPLGGNDTIHVPDGIAHFLEHKMFEDENGDVFQDFSKQGASANAFTSFTRTAYLFSSTTNVEKNLETLLDFVQHPYFTEESVEKEKGIIGQEITMYDDNPDWRAYFGVIENMFVNHPVKLDIAGTIESISNITKDLLYTCYQTFYHPNNMLLFIIGPVDPQAIMKQVKENQGSKSFAAPETINRVFDDEPNEVATEKNVIHMPVQTPKCLVGFKEANPSRQGEDLLKHELSINILLDLMFGQSSANYQKLYEQGLIDDSFSFDYSAEEGFGFTILGGDTKKPDELAEAIKEMITTFKQEALDESVVNRAVKKKIGSFLRSLNSPEYIANQFTRYQFNDMTLFDVVPVLEGITKEHLSEVLEEHFDFKRFTVCQVRAEK
ncbi:putative processing protease [Alkalihalophilus pseudofirmus OF4]|uniref:Processing protease n=2 Tax=Alkalihalophilus pseudofirmus TaxID=79885 RepID=D3FTY3_ALKPO|nr:MULTISPECIES: pitrilysin family protein [Alkalihalophilus]ADC51964.1 putative processing protease [Alkalihalophilus pseudofirmus OF4]MDV2885212.1 pitrilysin family protein [Alkalihalophilus pseudofirmus]MED1602350.1 pitrilysin family protein [Alkalihalophilus marmarensis]OLS37531.1 peptidase M16 [Alkalihalophilus pseudofirmus]WEG15562.1 pitrilysin family protein [Alkalihalophilus pseudofirmus]